MWNGSVVGSVEPGNAERTYDAAVVVEDGELVFDMEVEGEWVSVPETLTTYHVVGPMPDYVRDRLEKNGFSLTKR
jgi:hypothetical protein